MVEDKEVLNLLKTAKGQTEGIIKMVDDNRYCIDVLRQILAVQAIFKKVNLKIIDNHIKNCIKQAFEEGAGEEKVNEVIEIINRYAK